MRSENIIATIEIGLKETPRSEVKILTRRSKIIGNKMVETDNKLTINMGMTYPGILGQYSSLHINVGITVPADTENIKTQEEFDSAVDPYKMLVSNYVMNGINDACRQVGLEEPFPN